MIDENERWLLSFYRASEIAGALFFGRLATTLGPSRVQIDLSKHFADEAQHAWWWTDCLTQLGAEPLRLDDAYQRRYTAALGVPANLMEVLAITLVFERRVLKQYAEHARAARVRPEIQAVLGRIMADERWHTRWVAGALRTQAHEHGSDHVAAAVRRCQAADREVYARISCEHAERVHTLFDERS